MTIYEQQIRYIIEELWSQYSDQSPKWNNIEQLTILLYEQFYLNKQSDTHFENIVDISTHELQQNREINTEITDFKILKEYDDDHVIIEQLQRLYLIKEHLIINGKLQLTLIDTHSHENYCYVFGKRLDDNFPQALVRFYINLKPDYSIGFIEKLCQVLDVNKIQFSIKFFKNLHHYSRADNTILYVYKYEWDRFFHPLMAIFEASKTQLNPNIPFFTYPVCYGVGFGENPNNSKESFGSIRCKLIATSFLQSIHLGLSKDDLIVYILNQIIEKGYNINTFHLNPNSNFPYTFNT
jgi:hypothetical protein